MSTVRGRIEWRHRAERAEAQLSRLTALLEDREQLAGVVYEAESQFAAKYQDFDRLTVTRDRHLAVADRIRGYLKGQP